MKYYTTVEQSNRLVELNIPVDTADMYYNKFIDEDDSEYEIHCNKIPKLRALYTDYLPCWSTEAVLKLLPKNINHLFVLDDIFVFPANGYRLLYKNVRKYTDNERIITYSNDTLLNCAFEMIVKLKELKLI